MRAAPIAALLGLALSLSACSDSPEDVRADYCDEVADRQVELTELMAEEAPDTLLRAVPVLRELADGAPRDIRDEWDRLLDALDALAEALEAAGVDASAYDAKRPPESVTEEQQQDIARAADDLATQETVAAWEGVKQHAKDVCKTPLYQ